MENAFLTLEQWLALQPGDVIRSIWMLEVPYTVAAVDDAGVVHFTNGAEASRPGNWMADAVFQKLASTEVAA